MGMFCARCLTNGGSEVCGLCCAFDFFYIYHFTKIIFYYIAV